MESFACETSKVSDVANLMYVTPDVCDSALDM